ncbi:MAG: hypothetical protein GF390_01945 [Candidatus Pacebacteria bacterium]|nr:hypothetical protein [Candidatus Paceibacterota bacterium]
MSRLVKELPRHETAYVLTGLTRWLHPALAHTVIGQLAKAGIPELEVRQKAFGDGMPLYLVDSAQHALLLYWLTGETWEQVIPELCLVGSALTINPDQAGSNVDRLGVFLVIDGRQDRRTRKPFADEGIGLNEKGNLIVKSQFLFVPVIAKILAHVVKASYVCTVDLHSHYAAKSFRDEGLDFINLTALPVFADGLIQGGYINRGDQDVVISTTDLGGLPRAYAMSELLDVSLAIILKKRKMSSNDVDSQVESELAHGDLKDKIVILVDDMIASGGSMEKAVQLILKYGAREIIICATLPVCCGNYYTNLEKVLSFPQVRMIFVTDALPLQDRPQNAISLPYVFEEGEQKQMQYLPIGQYLGWAISVLLRSADLLEAKKELGNAVLNLRDPYSLYQEITGEELQRPEDVGVYHRDQQILLF